MLIMEGSETNIVKLYLRDMGGTIDLVAKCKGMDNTLIYFDKKTHQAFLSLRVSQEMGFELDGEGRIVIKGINDK